MSPSMDHNGCLAAWPNESHWPRLAAGLVVGRWPMTSVHYNDYAAADTPVTPHAATLMHPPQSCGYLLETDWLSTTRRAAQVHSKTHTCHIAHACHFDTLWQWPLLVEIGAERQSFHVAKLARSIRPDQL